VKFISSKKMVPILLTALMVISFMPVNATNNMNNVFKEFPPDIKLKILDDGSYDRELGFNDFKITYGTQTIKNSIILRLMALKNELNPNITYYDYGCDVWYYLKSNNIELTKLNIKEAIERALKKNGMY